MRSEVKVGLPPAGLGAWQETQIVAQADHHKMNSLSSYIIFSLNVFATLILSLNVFVTLVCLTVTGEVDQVWPISKFKSLFLGHILTDKK